MDLTTMSISFRIVWRAVGPDQIWLERHEPGLNRWVDDSTPVGGKKKLVFSVQLKKHVFDPTIDQWNSLTTELQTAFFYVIIELSR